MKETVEALISSSLIDKVKIMIGDRQNNKEVRDFDGADSYGWDSMAAVALTKRWAGGK